MECLIPFYAMIRMGTIGGMLLLTLQTRILGLGLGGLELRGVGPRKLRISELGLLPSRVEL